MSASVHGALFKENVDRLRLNALRGLGAVKPHVYADIFVIANCAVAEDNLPEKVAGVVRDNADARLWPGSRASVDSDILDRESIDSAYR